MKKAVLQMTPFAYFNKNIEQMRQVSSAGLHKEQFNSHQRLYSSAVSLGWHYWIAVRTDYY